METIPFVSDTKISGQELICPTRTVSALEQINCGQEMGHILEMRDLSLQIYGWGAEWGNAWKRAAEQEQQKLFISVIPHTKETASLPSHMGLSFDFPSFKIGTTDVISLEVCRI